MPQFTIMSYNIENMNQMFESNQIKPNEQQRAQKIAEVIQGIQPHVLGICEAANAQEENQFFIDNYLQNSGYQIAQGTSRGAQNLVFYYRDPVSVDAIDEATSFYEPWDVDIDGDGLKEHHKWFRKPLEAVFRIGQNGPQFRIILVHTKSKGIFSVVDLANFQKISLANRKRLIGQAVKLRSRMEQLVHANNALPLIVMGDMNDGPGLDPFEKMLGMSFVETAMGSVYGPEEIFHNALWWMTKDTESRKDLWTVEFKDSIVAHPFGYKHRVWIDHILLSPDMLNQAGPVRYVADSGEVAPKNSASRKASDHFAVFCKIETD